MALIAVLGFHPLLVDRLARSVYKNWNEIALLRVLKKAITKAAKLLFLLDQAE